MSEGWQTLGGGEEAASPSTANVARSTGLREAREATGLHIAALAAALKVPVKKLESLEAGRYNELPDLTFARALASSACRHLKIDAAPILASFPQANASTLGMAAPSVNTTFSGDNSGPMPWLAKLKSPPVAVTALVLLGALALAVLPDWSQWPGKEWFANSGGNQQQPGNSEATPVAALSEPVVAQPDPAVLPQGAGDSAPKSAVAIEQSAVAGASDSAAVLELEAVSDSWIEVIDGTGKVQIQRVLKTGDKVDFSSTPPFAVVLGRADAVGVKVRGQVFDVAPFARNSVARFSVK